MIPRSRSLFPGGTDYTGVGIEDILEHLRGWRDGFDATLRRLPNIRKRLDEYPRSPVVVDGVEHADYFVDLIARYRSDIDRLIEELPAGVLKRHVDTVEQLYSSGVAEERLCVLLKQRNYLDALPSDQNAPEHVVAEIYRLTRDEMIGMRDLDNVARRLRTFVTTASDPGAVRNDSAVNALELKPNFFGLGVNLNYIVERWGPRLAFWRRRDTGAG